MTLPDVLSPYDDRQRLCTVARVHADVIRDNDDVPRDSLLHCYPHPNRHRQHQQQQQQQHVVYNRRQRNNQQEDQQTDCERSDEVLNIDSLSDVLLTRIFYSGLRTDDLCRCAVVCRRWNRLVWNPLLWTSIDLSRAPDCDADMALRSEWFTFCLL